MTNPLQALALLAMLATALAFGAWMGVRGERANQRITAVIGARTRDAEIDDACDMASDAEERVIEL